MSDSEIMDLTPEELSELREIFDQIDADKSGEIDKYELRNYLDQLFQKEKDGERFPDELWPLVSFLCGSEEEDSEINFDEFVVFYDIIRKLDDKPNSAFKLLFEKIDLDGNKTVELDEFMLLAKILALNLSEQDLTTLFNSMDEDGSGHLTYDEVVSIFGIA